MTKKKRELKVYETSGYHYKATPTIMLKGSWLKNWGFEAGDKIVVECSNGELKIKKASSDIKIIRHSLS